MRCADTLQGSAYMLACADCISSRAPIEMAASATPEIFTFQELVKNGTTAVQRGVTFTIDVANPADKTCTDLLTDAFTALQSSNSNVELDKYTFQYLNKNLEANEQATTTVKKLMDDAGVVSIDYKVPITISSVDKKDFATIYNTAETVWFWNTADITRLTAKDAKTFGYAQMNANAVTRLELRTRYCPCKIINVVHVNSSDNEAVRRVVKQSNYLGEPDPENPYVYLQGEGKYGDDARKVYKFTTAMGEKSRIEVAEKDTVGNILDILEMIQSKADKMIVKLFQTGQRSNADKEAIFTNLFTNPKVDIMYSTSLASDQKKRLNIAGFLQAKHLAERRREEAAKVPKKAQVKSKWGKVDTTAAPDGGGASPPHPPAGGGGGGGGGSAGPEYAPYFTMLKVGVPRAAVDLKCEAAGLDPALLDNPPPSPPPPVGADHTSAILPADLSKMLEDALKRAQLQMDQAVLTTLREVREEQAVQTSALAAVNANFVTPVASPSPVAADHAIAILPADLSKLLEDALKRAPLQMDQAVLTTLKEVRAEQANQAAALAAVNTNLVAPVASPSTDGAAELKPRLDDLKTALASLQKQQHETTSVDEILHALNYVDEEHVYGTHVFTRGNIKKVRADIEENRQKVRATFDNLYEQYVHEKIEWQDLSDQVLARCRDVEHERDAVQEDNANLQTTVAELESEIKLATDRCTQVEQANKTLERAQRINTAREHAEGAIMAYRISCLGDDTTEQQRTHDVARKCIDALDIAVSQT